MGNISILKGGAKARDGEREWRLILRGGTCDSGYGGGLSVLIGTEDGGNWSGGTRERVGGSRDEVERRREVEMVRSQGVGVS